MKRLILLPVLLLCMSALQVEALTLKQNLGTSTQFMGTELNSIANNAYSAVSTLTYDNSVGLAGDGALRCRLELFVVFASAPTANTAVVVWLLRSHDGTNFEPTPTTSIGPGSALAITFPVNNGQTTTRGMVDIDCPPAKFKAVLKNDGTGQSFAATNNTLKIAPIVFTGN
jgi:hypothetical protein